MSFYTQRPAIKLLFLLNIIFFNYQANAQGTWTPLTHNAPHYNAGVMLLLTDGTVICKSSGGGSGMGTIWDRLTPDIHGSYINGTWTSTAPMADDRLYFSTQVLRDRRVYVAGGEYGSGGPKGEVYSPATNTWMPTPQIVYTDNISDANSEMLPDHTVLQAVVDTGNTKLNYIWNPLTNTYTQTGSCVRRDNEAAWVKLPDNSIIFIDNYSTTSERYIPATNTWINDANLPVELFDPYGFEQGGGFLLPNGQTYFIGSTPTSAYYTPSGSTAMGTWATGPAIPADMGAPDAASAMMPNGIILMALSPTPNTIDTFPNPTLFYEFNYLTNTYTDAGAPGGVDTLSEPSFVTNMLVLPDGTVLFSDQGDDQYYEYAPGSAPIAAGKPTVNSMARVSCDTFTAYGTLFNGITEGASYGDDWQISTNYPIIRLTSGTNVYYATTYNWNSNGVMRGASPDTTQFILPAGLPAGAYTLQVVANGNPSAAVPFNAGLSITPATSSICNGNSETLTDTWAGGTWSSSSTAIATVDATGSVTAVGTGIATISHKFGAGCIATATVTVNASPSAIGGSSSVCIGATATLTDGGSGTWASSNTAVATAGPGGIVGGVAADTATITYTLTGGCRATAVVTVNTTPLPISGSSSVCLGATSTLSDPGGGTWTSSNTSVATVGASTGVVTGVTIGTATIDYILGAGCAASEIVSVNPGTPAVITPSGPTIYCAGGSVTLGTTSGSGLTYQWQLGGAPIPGATDATYTITTTSGNYTVITANPSGGCISTSSVTAITVSPAPPVAAITPAGPTTFCAPGSVALNATTGTGVTYQWQVGGTGIPGATTASYTTSAGGNYTVVISEGLCISSSAVVSVTAISSAAATIAGPATVCNGGTITLTDAIAGGTWSSSNTSVATVSASGILSGMSAGTTSIAYIASTFCGTFSASETVTVNALQTPSVSIAASPAGVSCAGHSILFAATPVYGGATPTYVWTNSSTVVGTGASFSLAAPVTGDIIKCTMTGDYPCVSSAAPVASTNYAVTVEAPSVNAVYVYATDSVITAGRVDTFVAEAVSGGSAPFFQWYVNGVAVPGAISALFITSSLSNGDLVTCKETSSDPCASPNSVTSRGITIVVSASGVQQVVSTGNTFNLSPNPNEGEFTIKGTLSNQADQKVSIVVTDMLGQTVYEKTALADNGNLNEKITLSKSMANGTYIVSLTSVGDHAVYHIVIDK